MNATFENADLTVNMHVRGELKASSIECVKIRALISISKHAC